jgi:hypothetical protein
MLTEAGTPRDFEEDWYVDFPVCLCFFKMVLSKDINDPTFCIMSTSIAYKGDKWHIRVGI